jgi:hypothetical protein
MTNPQQTHSTPKILAATLGSLIVAVVILVTLVLPAEYDFDPLGTGEMLGLMGLSREGPLALTDQDQTFRVDSVSYELASFESVEYKYRLEQGASLLFDWQATGVVAFDLHAEPDGAEEGYAETFAKSRSAGERGTYVAQFSGIHGWFWENRTPLPVTVTLTSAGFYSDATEFRDGFVVSKQPPVVRDGLAF